LHLLYEEPVLCSEYSSSNNIDYIVNTNGNTMRNIGSGAITIDQFGENPNLSCEYQIYVKKKDYAEAKA